MSGHPVRELLSVVGLTKTDLMNKESKYALYISLVYTLSDIRMVVGGFKLPSLVVSPSYVISACRDVGKVWPSNGTSGRTELLSSRIRRPYWGHCHRLPKHGPQVC